jgi:hypothetical protein
MVLAAAVRQDGLMATTVTEGEPRELRMPFATSMRWQGKLATFAECFANCRAVAMGELALGGDVRLAASLLTGRHQ